MSDFVTGLREQLVAAAARERARRLPRPGPLAPTTLAAAVAAAVLAALVAVAVAGGLRGEPPAPERPATAARSLPGRALFPGGLEARVRYRARISVHVLSFVPADAGWFARQATQVDVLRIERRSGPASERTPSQFVSFARVTEVFDPGVRDLRASREPAPSDLHAWLSDHPDVRVGPAEAVVVAGTPGEAFDAEVSFTRPAHADSRCRPTCTRLSAIGGSFADGTHMRMLVLRTEPGPLTIILAGRSAGDLAEVEAAAEPLLESLRIGTR